jgi:small subunit ribosomal protein S21
MSQPNFSVEVHKDEPFERALRRFTSKMRKAGLKQVLKKRRFYTKPSVQKKIDKQKSIRRYQKAIRMTETGGRTARGDKAAVGRGGRGGREVGGGFGGER